MTMSTIKNIFRFICNCIVVGVSSYFGGFLVWLLIAVSEVSILVLYNVAVNLMPKLKVEGYKERYIITIIVYFPSTLLGVIPMIIKMIGGV